MVKPRLKAVPPQLYFECVALFFCQLGQKIQVIKLWRNCFKSGFYRASIFNMYSDSAQLSSSWIISPYLLVFPICFNFFIQILLSLLCLIKEGSDSNFTLCHALSTKTFFFNSKNILTHFLFFFQVQRDHPSREEFSNWSYSCRKTILCQLPKCDLSLKFIIRTLISSDASAQIF